MCLRGQWSTRGALSSSAVVVIVVPALPGLAIGNVFSNIIQGI